ncbi:MAG: helix-turn-helix domain-containing protein [Mycolicibacterium insubricum]|nr:TetR/AcrR family transcriptional regulator [Mycobacterium sp.]
MVPERVDAARNRTRLLDAARRLIAEHGAANVTMDDVATTAGVGKGTLFRRFGSRAELMAVLLDEDEQASQQAFLFGPPPLGPGAPPPARLCAFGEHRIRFAHRHHDLLSSLTRGPRPPDNPPDSVLRTHIRILLAAAGTTGDLDAQADALTALFDADYIQARLDAGHALDEQVRAWQSVATKLCGH